MRIAITRQISPAMLDCELTHLERTPIDLELARRQHRQYEQVLEELGFKVISLPAEPDLPDSVFVEDTAIVVDECAIITRPGADSRKPEIDSIARTLEAYRQLHYIQAPGTLDGGDVLRVGKEFFVGLTARSNQAAIDQMQAILAPYSYTVKGVNVTGCLHLKSAVTQVAGKTLLVNPAWVEKTAFPGFDFIEVDPSEPSAANAVFVDGRIIYSTSYPKTFARLEAAGIPMHLVDATEVAKAEGAVTCCSLLLGVG